VVEHPAEATVEELGDGCSAIGFARPDPIGKPPASGAGVAYRGIGAAAI
jgi:hypothetical protein